MTAMEIGADHATLYAILLFTIGLAGLLARREALMRLVSIEILFGAVILHLVSTSRLATPPANPALGEAMALIILLIALVTAAVGVAFPVASGDIADEEGATASPEDKE